MTVEQQMTVVVNVTKRRKATFRSRWGILVRGLARGRSSRGELYTEGRDIVHLRGTAEWTRRGAGEVLCLGIHDTTFGGLPINRSTLREENVVASDRPRDPRRRGDDGMNECTHTNANHELGKSTLISVAFHFRAPRDYKVWAFKRRVKRREPLPNSLWNPR